ncbi:HAMP domain-containing histidine kinase [Azospirillum sp. YIM B02556]|uniref:histidine kinase n=1 Tax=Azospirillum endophyticum TaxID=2800326 RepID=A0ABS1F4W0_9PROT|nr:HAMP domain-containing sensor histidine kinase [Azospirillum endophyticum]MBK1838460.1 HAMP domain-containing histidine kinase [Azospirillum endophyticum]
MTDAVTGAFRRFGHLLHRPRSLRWRLFVILLTGLAAAHGLSFGALVLERTNAAKAMMLGTLEQDVATSVALLDRLPPEERGRWLAVLERRTYRYELGPGLPGVPELGKRGAEIARAINAGAGPGFPVVVESIPGSQPHLQAHVTLRDGSPVTVDVTPALMPLAPWLPLLLAAQLVLLTLCSWLAVRQAIRPLARFAKAAETLDPAGKAARLEEDGPSEVAHAATAFNAMRDRIAHYLEERVRILAAISHDLQTPITRMTLRVEMAEDGPEKERLLRDLSQIGRLVREGVAYARSAHGDVETPARIDVGSFVESIAFDYQDMGMPVAVHGMPGAILTTRPHALRRILTNLIDNALKFAGEAELMVTRDGSGRIAITVRDNGPGIPENQLGAVLQPFYRLEQSRNRDSGGTGLGLAIAHQLALAIGGSLTLRNRHAGGLCAEVTLG